MTVAWNSSLEGKDMEIPTGLGLTQSVLTLVEVYIVLSKWSSVGSRVLG